MHTNESALSLQPEAFDLESELKRVVDQTIAIQRVMKAVMRQDEHYGIIPGTKKPSLYQAGADKICLLFRLRPAYEEVAVVEKDNFISLKIRCHLHHIPTGQLWGEGMGSANSREDKYLKQATAKVCPKCQQPAIIRGREEYGGGWVCFAKKDGCNAKFVESDPAIVGQSGLIVSDRVWNMHNTILKIACKRSRVASVLTATAAGDLFTQDLEDLEDIRDVQNGGGGDAPADAKASSAPKTSERKKATPNQVVELNVALGAQNIPAEDRVSWAAAMLGREVPVMQDLSPEEITKLIKAAKAGETPRAAAAGGR